MNWFKEVIFLSSGIVGGIFLLIFFWFCFKTAPNYYGDREL